jgi:hypothetical protein
VPYFPDEEPEWPDDFPLDDEDEEDDDVTAKETVPPNIPLDSYIL